MDIKALGARCPKCGKHLTLVQNYGYVLVCDCGYREELKEGGEDEQKVPQRDFGKDRVHF